MARNLNQAREEIDAAHERAKRTPNVGDTADATWVSDHDENESLSFLTPSAQPESLGRLGHYEVLEVIGRGGMGIVLRACDEKLRRVVAVKVMAPLLATNATARKRFSREAQAAAAVSHDHVVTIHAVEEVNGLPYLVMQYVAGVSLQQRIERTGPLQTHEILRIGMQTAAGLAAAHAQGLIHRDIKPANILLENGIERVKITDFGLARVAADASLTQSGVVAGTPHYMSPEQARGEAVDQRSDLFSLGSVLYAMCSGLPPFRANTSLAVLKRVCDETPTPIREVNPNIPEWLAAIIGKLHAKSPGERYASAAEVATLLGDHLAQVQQPSDVRAARVEQRAVAAARTRRLPIALTVVSLLLCLAAALAFMEARGITNFRTALARIIGQGETKEEPVQPGPNEQPAPTDADVFVVLDGSGAVSSKFETLAAVVAAASDGDTIEIRGNGPFVSEPIEIQNRALTIRAGAAFHPVIRFLPGKPGDDYLLRTNTAMVLEGLEIREISEARSQPALVGRTIILCTGDSLDLANCRVLQEEPAKEDIHLLGALGSLRMRNCELRVRAPGTVVAIGNDPPLRLVMENCIVWGTGGVVYFNNGHPTNTASFQLHRNTMSTAQVASVGFSAEPLNDTASCRTEFETSSNVFDLHSQTLIFEQIDPYLAAKPWPDSNDVRKFALSTTRWREQANVYRPAGTSVLWHSPGKHIKTIFSEQPPTLAEWNSFWSLQGTNSTEGPIRFAGGDPFARAGAKDDKLTPADFRLLPESAGYRAGAEGQDLGADVDLVGPGPAYARWKESADYQDWLKLIRQQRSAVSKSESKAFFILGDKQATERKFSTLTTAIAEADDGDTIEVRGNGPFATSPLQIGKRALAIRAGDGFRPVIRWVRDPAQTKYDLLSAEGRLVLEGLEFRADPVARDAHRVAIAGGSSLYVANCRFAAGNYFCIWNNSRTMKCVMKNCEFLIEDGDVLSGYHPAGSRGEIDNCVQVGGNIFDSHCDTEQLITSVQLTRTTHAAGLSVIHILPAQQPAEGGPSKPWVQLQASANVLGSENVVGVTHDERLWKDNPLPSGEAAHALHQRLISWHGQHNAYAERSRPAGEAYKSPEFPNHVTWVYGPTDLASWGKFWESAETGSVQGPIRLKGGDLAARLKTAPQDITPDDFRLRPGSAGYRAGADGKDLGADVDLVGPGPGYERWKATPEYRQWLKDSGQAR